MQSLRHKLASLREQWEAEKLGMGDVQATREQQAAVEHEFDQLSADIKEKQAAGQPIDEQTFQRAVRTRCAPKARWRRKSKPNRTARVPSPSANVDCCAKKLGRKKSPRSSAPGPACRSRG